MAQAGRGSHRGSRPKPSDPMILGYREARPNFRDIDI
jgi:hypothetical protein